MASTGGRGGILRPTPPHSPNLRELAELVRSRHRGVGGGVGWRRLGGDSSARRHELWPSPKGQLTAGIGQLPSACGRLGAPRLGGSDRAWRARQPCTRRGRRLRTARVALALSCRCTLWRRWCNAPGQWARRAAGAPLATRCASCSGAVDAAGGGESTAGGLAWPPFASVPGTSADLAGCSLDQQRVGSARCAVRRPTRRTCSGVPACAVCGAHNAAVGNRRSGSAPVAEVGRALLRARGGVVTAKALF